MAMTALDYEGIRQLLARYSFALDFGVRTAIEACFTPDAYFAEAGLPPEVPNAGPFEGRERIGAFAATFFASAQGHLRHWSSPPLIEGDGQTATGLAFLMVLRPGSAPDTGVILTGVYRDRYTKIDDRWYFAAREFTADPQPEHAGSVSMDPLVVRFDDFVAGRRVS
jgi:hypothetical protein